jgi:hypothetical protein
LESLVACSSSPMQCGFFSENELLFSYSTSFLKHDHPRLQHTCREQKVLAG